LSGLFSSTIQVVIAHVAGGNTTLDIKTQVPEPGTLGLLGLGLIAAWGVAARRRA